MGKFHKGIPNDFSDPFVVWIPLPRFGRGARALDYKFTILRKAASGQATWNTYSKRMTMTAVAAAA
jgi:hypothetical protein